MAGGPPAPARRSAPLAIPAGPQGGRARYVLRSQGLGRQPSAHVFKETCMADHIVKVLNHLIETSKNGELGFKAAADDTKDPTLKQLFGQRALDCASGAAELQRVVTELGGKPEDSGTVAGAVHRGWTNLKAAVSSRTDLAILEECERGEDVAKAAYADALKETLPENIRVIVQRQQEGVIRNHDQIRDLRNRYKAEK